VPAIDLVVESLIEAKVLLINFLWSNRQDNAADTFNEKASYDTLIECNSALEKQSHFMFQGMMLIQVICKHVRRL